MVAHSLPDTVFPTTAWHTMIWTYIFEYLWDFPLSNMLSVENSKGIIRMWRSCPTPVPALLPFLPYSRSCPTPVPALLPYLPYSRSCPTPVPALHPFLLFSRSCSTPVPALHPFLLFSRSCSTPVPALLPFLPYSRSCSTPVPALCPFLLYSRSCSTPASHASHDNEWHVGMLWVGSPFIAVLHRYSGLC